MVNVLINGISNNNVYLNKFGDDTFLSSMQKKNQEALKQEQILNADDENNSTENQMTEKIKEEEIAQKIAEGKSVSLKELKYIKKNNGELLQKAKKANVLKKNIKTEIKSAKTEDEAVQIINKASLNALMSITSDKNSEEGNIEFNLQNEAVNKAKSEAPLKKIDKLIY